MKRFFSAPLLLFAGIILCFQSCVKDNAENDNADARAKFIGQWSVNESWHKSNYEVRITADPYSLNRILIEGFANPGGSGSQAKATVSGNSISLDADQVIGDDWVINGGGVYDPETEKIFWNYTLHDGATLYTVTATYTKI